MQPPRILLAYDGSLGADAVLSTLASLPWPAGSHFRVLGTRDAHLRFLRPRADELLLAEFEEVVGRAAARLRADVREGVMVEQRVVRGPVLPTILGQAACFGADLIVVGSRNHGPLRSGVFGSIGRELIASAQMPVLVARGGCIDHVLLAYDGSQAARAAVQIVATWPIFAESSVRMFLVAEASAADATAQILTAAALEESRLIVLGSAAAHGFDRLVHGDLADDLVPRTRCSLLVVPAMLRSDLKPRELALSR